ncbi:type II toxin-antitoxin system YafQ family toxin [Helicobacter pylori]|nr:type II toxin-antitoxin system YafQ family toxin [Helicobacter pylori]
MQRPPAQRCFIKDFRECHIKADILLVYLVKDDELILLRLGSHSELFCKSPTPLITPKLIAHQLPPLFRGKTPLTLFYFLNILVFAAF